MRNAPCRLHVRPEERALSPVVGKVFEVSIVLLYLGLLTTTLYGGVVPEYRSAAGDEVADRSLAAAAQDVEAAIPPATLDVDVRRTVDLPRTIRGDTYHVRVDDRTLVVDHPDAAVAASAPLAVPEAVVQVEGSWSSTAPALVVVERTVDGLVVRLERGAPT